MGIGLIRVLLAFVVVVAHTHPVYGFNIGNSTVAVRAFFLISGFYMSMILAGKYKSYSLFLTNRILRVYPIYWCVLILTILVGFGAHFITGSWGEIAFFHDYLAHLNPITFIVLIVANIAVLGRDIISFATLSPGTGLLGFHGDIAGNQSAMNFLLVPQAWTLALEMLFYLIAPFLVRQRTTYVLAIFSISVAVKWYLATHGLTNALWTFRFFPAELCFFVLGIVSFRLYEKVAVTKWTKLIGLASTLIIILFFSFINYIYSWLSLTFIETEWLFYIALTFFLPFIFLYSKNFKHDRKIGELSYPIYISHILVLNVSAPLIFNRYINNNNLKAIFVFVLAAIFSWILIKIVQEPIDRYRENRVRLGTNK